MRNSFLNIISQSFDSQDENFDLYIDPFNINFPASVEFSLSPEDYGIPHQIPSCSAKVSDDMSLAHFSSSASTAASSLEAKSKKICKASKKADKKSESAKKSSGTSSQKRVAWKSCEDEQLLELFRIHGSQWAKIASEMKNRTRKQVRDRYLNVLVPNINKAPWTEEEDQVILDLLKKIGTLWCRISEALDGRTEMQVKNRFNLFLKKKEEEEFQQRKVEIFIEEEKPEEKFQKGFDPADMISFENETEEEASESTQLQGDFDLYIDPLNVNFPIDVDFSLDPADYGIEDSSSYVTFSEEMDLTPKTSLSTATSSLETNSKKIFKTPRKTDKEPKLTKKSSGKTTKQKRSPWTSSEDEQLLHLYRIHGPKWAKIAKDMKDRKGKQIRDRYLNVLVPNINKDPWSEEEDRIILFMLERYGPLWCRIAETLKGRTEIQVKNRYNTYLKKKLGIKSPSGGVNNQVIGAYSVEEVSPRRFDTTEMISYK